MMGQRSKISLQIIEGKVLIRKIFPDHMISEFKNTFVRLSLTRPEANVDGKMIYMVGLTSS